MKRLAIAFAFVAALISSATAQPNLTNLPSGTVIGRLQLGPGQAQAIPLATLLTNEFSILCTTSGAVPLYNATNGLWECSTAGNTGDIITLNGGPLTITPVSGSAIVANGPVQLGAIGQTVANLAGTTLAVNNNSGNGQARFAFDNAGPGLLINQNSSGGLVSFNQQANANLAITTNNGSGTTFTLLPASGATLTVGPLAITPSGTNLGLTTLAPSAVCDALTVSSTLVHLCDGSNASPHTAQTSTIGISRVDAVTGPSTQATSTLWVNTVSTSVLLGPSNGVYSKIQQNGAGDTVALLGISTYSGTGAHIGYGAYLEGNSTVANAGGVILQGSAGNATGATISWNGAAFSQSGFYGIDAVCGASAFVTSTANCTAAFDIRGAAFKWDVGIGFFQGSVQTTSIEDDSSSSTVLKITGSHGTAVIDGSTATFGGNIFNFPSFLLTGAGNITATENTNGAAQANWINSSAGTGAFAGYAMQNSTNSAIVALTSTGWTAAPTLIGPNRLAVRGVGAGIVIETSTALPIIFGISDAEVGRWNASTPGELDIGVNATTGGSVKYFGATQGSVTFKIAANVNANSTITWPNGTTDFSATGGTSNVVKQTSAGAAFTVGQLAASDLSNGTTGSGNIVLASTPTITTPLIAEIDGGTLAASSLTLKSTTGVGSGDKIIFLTGSQAQSGFITGGSSPQWVLSNAALTPTASVILTASNNTATTMPSVLSGTMAEFIGADGTIPRVAIIGAGTVAPPVLNTYYSRGTVASPTAVQSGDTMGAFGGIGYGTSFQTSGGASVQWAATEIFDGTHGGTVIRFLGTPNTTTTAVPYFSVGGNFTAAFYNLGTGAGGGALCGVSGMTSGTGGSVTYQNAAACTTSLRQFKRDIEPLQPVGQYASILDEVMALKTEQFYFRNGYVDSGARQRIGMIADEVERIDPRMATYDSNGNLSGVDYVYSLTVAFKAIQEVVGHQESDRQRLVRLEADNDNLRAELAELRKAVNR